MKKQRSRFKGLLNEFLFEPYARDTSPEAWTTAFIFRLAVLVPLITVPTYLNLRHHLPTSHAPDVAVKIFRLWTSVAAGYIILNSIGILSSRNQQLTEKYHLTLHLLCALCECTLTQLVAYALGNFASGIGFYLGTLVAFYRMYFDYKVGLAVTMIAFLSGLHLLIPGAVELTSAPILTAPLPEFIPTLQDRLGPLIFIACAFLAANLAANRLHKLRSRLQNTMDELETTQARLVHRERMASMGNLASGFAHELGNPLHMALSASETVAENLEDLETAAPRPNTVTNLRQGFNILQRAITRLDSTLDSLRFYVNSPTDPCYIPDVGKWLHHSLELYGSKLQAQSIKLQLDAPSEIGIYASPRDLNQIVARLIDNSLTAMPDGGELKIQISEAGDDTEIRIADTGPGIPSSLRDRIFEPFFSTKEEVVGSGIGLSIAHQLAEDNHGELTLESADEGVCFSIRLPARDPQTPEHH